MRLRPLPVIMVSSLTERGAAATISAMEIGAVDCVAKPSSRTSRRFRRPAGKGEDRPRGARVARPRRRAPSRPRRAPTARAATALNGRLVAIGASTGGVEALLAILSQFPGNARRRWSRCICLRRSPRASRSGSTASARPSVAEATHGAPILPGRSMSRRARTRISKCRARGQLRCVLREGDLVSGHRPSVDALFHSVAKAAGAHGGRRHSDRHGRATAPKDCSRCASAGARTIGQDEATCVVYGMPKSRLSDRRGREAAAAAIDRGRNRRADVDRSSKGLTEWPLASKLEVMVVDDTSVSRMLITESLARDRHQQSRARQGRQAGARRADGEARASRHLRSEHARPRRARAAEGAARMQADRQDRLHPGDRQLPTSRWSSAGARSGSTTSSPSRSRRRRSAPRSRRWWDADMTSIDAEPEARQHRPGRVQGQRRSAMSCSRRFWVPASPPAFAIP